MTTQNTNEAFSNEEIRSMTLEMLSQMGGHRMLAMVGGMAIFGRGKGGYPELTVTFKTANPGRINRVIVTLCWTDTYRVQFLRVTKTGACALVRDENDVYAEDLIPLFESITGLRTSL